MQNISVYLITGILMFLMFTGCANFPTSYQHIETDKVRVLDFVYDPCEAAPGDTVKVKALFAGKEIKMEDLDFSVSWRVLQNAYGMDSAFDRQEPTFVTPPELRTVSDKTTEVTFSIKVPKNIMYESPTIPENWMDVLPGTNLDMIPEQFRSMSKSQFISSTEQMINMIRSGYQPDSSTVQLLPAILEFLSVKFRLFVNIKVPGGYETRSDYCVRYNSELSEIPDIYIFKNTNPVIDSVGILKVHEKGRTLYDTSEHKHEFIRLYGPQDSLNAPDSTVSVVLDKDYSYFAMVFTHGKDSSWTKDLALKYIDNKKEKDSLITESFSTMWFYQLEDEEVKEVKKDNQMSLEGSYYIQLLTPPKDSSVQNFTIWCKEKDDMWNDINRTSGSTIHEVHGKFVYTEAYLKANKK